MGGLTGGSPPASQPYKPGMSDHLDKKLGADPNYQAARSETAGLLQELRVRLEDEPDVWQLILELEATLQGQVAVALDVGFALGRVSPHPPEHEDP